MDQIYSDLKGQLPEIKEALATGVKYGGELFHRFIVYDLIISSLWILLGLIVLMFGIWLFRYGYKEGSAETSAFAIIPIVIPLIIFAINISIILKDIFIPELRLLALISNL